MKLKNKANPAHFRPAGISDEDEDEDDFCDGYDRPTRRKWHEENLSNQPLNYFEIFSKEVSLGNLQGVADAVDKIVPPTTVDSIFSGGWNALMNACHFGFVDIVEFLLKKGANPNFANKLLFTPLMSGCSSFKDNEKQIIICIQLLIKNDVNLNASDTHGVTALMYACKSGFTSIVQLLVENNANLNIQDSQGWTALFWAVNQGKLAEVEILVKAGAKKKKKDERGRTAYDVAAGREGLEQIAALLCPKTLRDAYDNVQDSDDSDVEEETEVFKPYVKKSLEEMQISNLTRTLSKESHPQLDITTFLTITDEELSAMGIKYPWHRRQTLEYIKGFHLQKWKQPESKSQDDKKSHKITDGSGHMKHLTYATLTRYFHELEIRLSILQASVAYVTCQCPWTRSCGTEEAQVAAQKKVLIFLDIVKRETKKIKEIITIMTSNSSPDAKKVVSASDLVVKKKSFTFRLLSRGLRFLMPLVAVSSVAAFVVWKNKS